eukprot:1168042_1
MNLEEEKERHDKEEKQKAEQQSIFENKQKKFLEQLKAINQSDQQQKKQQKAKRTRISQSNHEFVAGLNNAVITIPDQVVDYNLEKAGCNCPDLRVRRLIGIAAKKMIFDICTGANSHRDHHILSLPAVKQKAYKNKVIATFPTHQSPHICIALMIKYSETDTGNGA